MVRLMLDALLIELCPAKHERCPVCERPKRVAP
jgi:hypothetical protein